jgi:WD40 repeat protein
MDEAASDPFHTLASTIIAIAVSPDGNLYACLHGHELRICHTGTHADFRRIELIANSNNTALKFSPDGRHIAAHTYWGLNVWNLESLTCIYESKTAGIFAISPDSNYLVSATPSGRASIWNMTNRRVIDASGSPPQHEDPKQVTCIAFAQVGGVVASGTYDGLLRVWTLETDATLFPPLQCHDAGTMLAVFSPDDRQIATGSEDKMVRIWDWHAGSLDSTLQGHTSYITSIAFSPDGSKIISCSPREQLVWDATSHVRIYATKIDPILRRWSDSVSFLHVLDDGWVVDLGNQPILWVPAEKRKVWAVHGSEVFLGGPALTIVDISGVPVS